ncbi:hypothetical protein [Pricia antarctica]|uniref:hypothetical protein n=1 Tax=Pricia antarctica TaxID=641691 RepID=UPI001587617B|nr:hypothetical protein [Pricia antarctica]
MNNFKSPLITNFLHGDAGQAVGGSAMAIQEISFRRLRLERIDNLEHFSLPIRIFGSRIHIFFDPGPIKVLVYVA